MYTAQTAITAAADMATGTVTVTLMDMGTDTPTTTDTLTYENIKGSLTPNSAVKLT